MALNGRIPPRSETSFRRKYFLAWSIIGAAAFIAGLFFGPRLNHTHNPWLSIELACAMYVGSLLICPLVLMRLWRKPSVTATVLLFSAPIGGIGIGIIFIMRVIGPSYMYISKPQLFGLYFAVLILYGASLVWAVGVGFRRKRLGHFDVEPRG